MTSSLNDTYSSSVSDIQTETVLLSALSIKNKSSAVQAKNDSRGETRLVDLMRKRPNEATVSFSGLDYGYGDNGISDAPHKGFKRRRFQRRNSKTPQMLLGNLLPLSFLDCSSEHGLDSKPSKKSMKVSDKDGDFDDEWEDGVEIAEQLVKHMRERRRSSATSTTTETS